MLQIVGDYQIRHAKCNAKLRKLQRFFDFAVSPAFTMRNP